VNGFFCYGCFRFPAHSIAEVCFEEEKMLFGIRHPQPNPIWFAGSLEVKFHVEIVNEGISRPDIATEQLIYFNEPLFVVKKVIQNAFYFGLLC
jgi:hypothetical protein